MKKVLKVVGIVVVVLVVAVILLNLYANGFFDTRFWSNDGYDRFYDGLYIGNDGFEAGTYEVEVRGGLSSASAFTIYPDYKAYQENKNGSTAFLSQGDKGFRFTLNSGEVLEFHLHNNHEMRIKKLS